MSVVVRHFLSDLNVSPRRQPNFMSVEPDLGCLLHRELLPCQALPRDVQNPATLESRLSLAARIKTQWSNLKALAQFISFLFLSQWP